MRYGYDPLLSREEIERFGVKAFDESNVKVDCVIVAVAHDEFRRRGLGDLRRMFNDKAIEAFGAWSERSDIKVEKAFKEQEE